MMKKNMVSMLIPLVLWCCTQISYSFLITAARPKFISIQQSKISPRSSSPSTCISNNNYETIISTLHAKKKDEEEDDTTFEWDGIVIEGAHDDEFDSVDDTEEFVMPSMTLLSMANSVESPALMAATNSDFDVTKNQGKLHQLAMEKEEKEFNEDDLLEMGGDPSFLDDFDDGDHVKYENKGIDGGGDDADFFLWDGEVNEDAHLD